MIIIIFSEYCSSLSPHELIIMSVSCKWAQRIRKRDFGFLLLGFLSLPLHREEGYMCIIQGPGSGMLVGAQVKVPPAPTSGKNLGSFPESASGVMRSLSDLPCLHPWQGVWASSLVEVGTALCTHISRPFSLALQGRETPDFLTYWVCSPHLESNSGSVIKHWADHNQGFSPSVSSISNYYVQCLFLCVLILSFWTSAESKTIAWKAF